MTHFIHTLIVLIVFAACNAEGAGSLPPDAMVLPQSPSQGCSPANCDDGVACTEDRCMQRICWHLPSVSLCAAGQTCDPRIGCATGRACAVNTDCTDMDPCTANERCDPSARVCLRDVLDGDRDGDPPRSCGGNDCDDSDPRRRPGLPDRCDGIDNDCNGVIDDHPTDCLYPGATCLSGNCVYRTAASDPRVSPSIRQTSLIRVSRSSMSVPRGPCNAKLILRRFSASS